MKKTLSFFAVLMLLGAFAPRVWGQTQYYDFSATAPNGQTLYYKIRNSGSYVEVTYPCIAPDYSTYYYGYPKPTGNLVIPSTVTYNGITYTVKKIFSMAFCQCTGLTQVIIPGTITDIHNQAFNGCSGLTSVTIGNNVTSIGDYAFENCSGLTSVTIPISVTSIGKRVFHNCSGLTSLVWNADSCIVDGEIDLLFEGCTNLTSITIGNNVRTIGGGAFRGCTGLTMVNYMGTAEQWNSIDMRNNNPNLRSCDNDPVKYSHNLYLNGVLLTDLVFPDTTTVISRNFMYDTALNSVTIPNSVTQIGELVFQECSGLTSVTLGSGVSSIGGAAFYNCTGLTEIHSLSPVAPQLETGTSSYSRHGVFEGVPSSIPIYIPCGSSNSYYSRWSYFSNFIEEEGFTFTATSADEQQGTVQILTMPTCTSPQAVVYASANSGYHFDHWSDNSTVNPYSLTVTEDLNLVAYFATDGGGTDGIDDIDAAGIRIYIEAGRIVVEGTTDEVNVYDMTGRNIRNDNLPAGVYMVKVGTLPARKVVVMR